MSEASSAFLDFATRTLSQQRRRRSASADIRGSMSYRTILMPVLGNETDDHLVRPVLDLAKVLGSRVNALYVTPDTVDVITQINRELPTRVIEDLIYAARNAAKLDLATAHAVLAAAARSAGLTVREMPGTAGDVSLEVGEGILTDVVTEEALFSDLVVFEHPAQCLNKEMRTALESVLLVSGRPLLLVPHHVQTIAGTKAVIGWDGSVAAAHAITAAIPLLKRAASIEIVTVTPTGLDIDQMNRLQSFLRLHGLNATESAIDPGSQQTGAALLNAARKAGAGLLVVGGYGHSRFREFVLGGVTRHIFANASIPVLMAH